MFDLDALLRGIIAQPDDDALRLILADYLQEQGDDDRADFIRDQVELARTPEWEPFAVRWSRRSEAERAGDRWRSSLPWHESWSPRFPFRRGLGYAVRMSHVQHLLDAGAELFESAPLGELHLPGGSMDEYRELARQPWLPRVRSARFWTLTTPTEPVRALAASPLATGLQSIHFEKASSPGMSFLVEGLFQSFLGRQLRELIFHVGDGSQLDLVEAFESGGETFLERLTFDNMGFDTIAAARLSASPVLTTLRSLEFANMYFSDAQLEAILGGRLRKLQRLVFRDMGFRSQNPDALVPLANRVRFPNLRQLDFTNGYGFREQLPAMIRKLKVGLRSLRLGGIRFGEGTIREIVDSDFWPYLVELDLHSNELDEGAARFLLAATPPKELTVLDLRDNPGIPEIRYAELRNHFGEALRIGSLD